MVLWYLMALCVIAFLFGNGATKGDLRRVSDALIDALGELTEFYEEWLNQVNREMILRFDELGDYEILPTRFTLTARGFYAYRGIFIAFALFLALGVGAWLLFYGLLYCALQAFGGTH